MRISGGIFKNHPIKSPKGFETRPTSSKLREALFNICQHRIEGIEILDLFAGSGAMGLEALSRGASKGVFIDNHSLAKKAIDENILSLGLKERAYALKMDVFKAIQALLTHHESFDIIFADPPYHLKNKAGTRLSEELIYLIDQTPLLKPSGLFCVEEGSFFQLSHPLSTLKLIDERKYGSAYLTLYEKSLSDGNV